MTSATRLSASAAEPEMTSMSPPPSRIAATDLRRFIATPATRLRLTCCVSHAHRMIRGNPKNTKMKLATYQSGHELAIMRATAFDRGRVLVQPVDRVGRSARRALGVFARRMPRRVVRVYEVGHTIFVSEAGRPFTLFRYHVGSGVPRSTAG